MQALIRGDFKSRLVPMGISTTTYIDPKKLISFKDCIGSAFNAKGAMECPNCRQVEGGQWLYSSGSLMQQESYERNDYARLVFEVAYSHNENERPEESFDEMPRWPSRLHEMPRWPSRLHEHYPTSQGEEDDSSINSYIYPRADDRQHQGVQRYQTSGRYMPSISGLDPRHASSAVELTRWTTHLMEVERPLHQDLWTSRGSAAYAQNLQPRSYEHPNVNSLPEIYPLHMLERSGYRWQMNDNGYAEHSLFWWPRWLGGYVRRRPSNMDVEVNPQHANVLRSFGVQGQISSLEQSNFNRFEASQYGQFARRADGSYLSHVSSGLQDSASSNLGHGYDAHSSHFQGRGVLWMGTRIPQL